jgi:hypothetical protein
MGSLAGLQPWLVSASRRRKKYSELDNAHRLGAKFVTLVPRLFVDANDPDTAMPGLVFPIERDDDAG